MAAYRQGHTNATEGIGGVKIKWLPPKNGRIGNLLHTSHRNKRVRPPDCLSARCLPGEGGKPIPALNSCVLDSEVQEQVKIPVPIDIL